VLPRSKRFLYDSGLHSPLIIRIPENFSDLWPARNPGSSVSEVISFIDMPKTWLSIAGAAVPEQMQGRIFLGSRNEPERKYHFAYRGRMDERHDNVRAVRGKRFLYVRNYMPFLPDGQHLNYLWKMRAVQAWCEHHHAGRTDEITGAFFRPKQPEALYDTLSDPDNVNNLIHEPEYSDIVTEMRATLRSWQLSIHDAGMVPESDLIRRAEKAGMTIYEVVRSPQLYNLKAYVDAAVVASDRNPKTIAKLMEYLQSDDAGLRYWGAVGCAGLGNEAGAATELLKACLNDCSDEVRAMSAWALYLMGHQDRAMECFRLLLREHSYALLSVLNVIDHLGERGRCLFQDIAVLQWDSGCVNDMRTHLIRKFSPQE
jgi:N-sulfoglucosamine sulfohydrolase